MQTIKIKSWHCQTCNYAQDFEPNAQNIYVNFTTDQAFMNGAINSHNIIRREAVRSGQPIPSLPGVLPEGACSACFLKGSVSILTERTSETTPVEMTIAEEGDVKTETIVDAETGEKTEVEIPLEEGSFKTAEEIAELKARFGS